MGAINSD